MRSAINWWVPHDGHNPLMSRPHSLLLDVERYPCRYELTPRYTDLDTNWHLNNVAISLLVEDANARFYITLDRSPVIANTIVVAHREISYLAEGSYPDPVSVHMGVITIGRTSWRTSSLVMQGGTIIAQGLTTQVLTQRGEGTLPLPDAWRHQLEGRFMADAETIATALPQR